MNDLIAALATPAGRSAMAIVRLSGQGSIDLVESLMKLDSGRLRGMRRAVGSIYRGHQEVDSVVALSWPEGKSYTGEEMVELICHGVPSIARDILSLLAEHGAVEPEPGEFTRRAFLAGTLDGVDVIALSALWYGGEAGIAGAFREATRKVLGSVEKTREELEGRIEFGDSHGVGISKPEAEDLFCRIRDEVVTLGRKARILDGRSRVFLMGLPNTGKSTLFNLLAGGEHAVVSERPGTTRDGSSAEVEIEGRSLLLHDTAGAGGVGLDGEAWRIAEASLTDADRIVWLSDGSEAGPSDIPVSRGGELLMVQSKADMHSISGFRVSSLTGEGVPELRRWLSSSPGELSLAGLALAVAREIEEAAEYLKAGEEAVSANVLEAAASRLRSILREEELGFCIERALSKLCVGK
jgi:tRNA modification GTPase